MQQLGCVSAVIKLALGARPFPFPRINPPNSQNIYPWYIWANSPYPLYIRVNFPTPNTYGQMVGRAMVEEVDVELVMDVPAPHLPF